MLRRSHHSSNTAQTGTVIGTGVTLTGTLKDKGPIIINGYAKGELVSEADISVGEGAHIQGPIQAQSITISGKVEGEVKATDSLEITETGKLEGSIQTETLIIQPGAKFNGQCLMKHQIETKPVENLPDEEEGEEEDIAEEEPEPPKFVPPKLSDEAEETEETGGKPKSISTQYELED